MTGSSFRHEDSKTRRFGICASLRYALSSSPPRHQDTKTQRLGVLVAYPLRHYVERERVKIVAKLLPGEQDAVEQRAMPAALVSAGAAPRPGPAFQWGRAAHEHAVDQAVGAGAGDRDAGGKLPSGFGVERRVVVFGENVERLSDGVTRWERGGKRGIRVGFVGQLVKDGLSVVGRRLACPPYCVGWNRTQRGGLR